MMPHRCDSPCSFQVLRMAEETVGGLSNWQRSFCTPEVPKGWSARVRAVRGWIKIRERNSTDSTHSRRWMPLEETMCASQKPNLRAGAVFHEYLKCKELVCFDPQCLELQMFSPQLCICRFEGEVTKHGHSQTILSLHGKLPRENPGNFAGRRC